MTVIERPLKGRVDIQRLDTIEHPEEVLYSQGGVDLMDWYEDTGDSVTVYNYGPPQGSVINHPATTGSYVYYDISGLRVGAPHTFTASVRLGGGGATASIGVDGVGKTGPLSTPGFTLFTYSFTATATTHRLIVTVEDAGEFGTTCYVDDITLTQGVWTEPVWVTHIENATGVSIRRGGSRTGLGIKTDVGLMTFSLHNSEDPMAGGVFTPGQTVRAVSSTAQTIPGPDVVVTPAHDIEHVGAGVIYSHGFEGDVRDSWTIGSAGSFIGNSTTARTGTAALATGGASTGAHADRAFTGLTVGAPYTFSAWVRKGNDTAASYSLGVAGIGSGAAVSVNFSGGWKALTYTFTATATSHTLQLIGPTTSGEHWDDMTVTSNDWTEHVPDEYGPGPVAFETLPIFTGRVVDVDSSYPLNKTTGESRTRTTVTVADAVGIHATTPRYGVTVPDPFFETFEARINRLESSAQAPVEAPLEGAPREVYAL